MGAEWPAGAALATESWPARSRGLMASVLQGSWALGYLVAAVLYATMFDVIGWRGMLWIGVLPALAVVWIRFYVKEPEVLGRKPEAAEGQQDRDQGSDRRHIPQRHAADNIVHLLVADQRVHRLLFDLRTVRDLHDEGTAFSAAAVGWPLAFSNGLTFLFSFLWGSLADSIGRRWAMIIPATIGIAVAPLYLLTTDYTTIAIAFSIQGAFAGAIYGINPELCERTFPRPRSGRRQRRSATIWVRWRLASCRRS